MSRRMSRFQLQLRDVQKRFERGVVRAGGVHGIVVRLLSYVRESTGGKHGQSGIADRLLEELQQYIVS